MERTSKLLVRGTRITGARTRQNPKRTQSSVAVNVKGGRLEIREAPTPPACCNRRPGRFGLDASKIDTVYTAGPYAYKV